MHSRYSTNCHIWPCDIRKSPYPDILFEWNLVFCYVLSWFFCYVFFIIFTIYLNNMVCVLKKISYTTFITFLLFNTLISNSNTSWVTLYQQLTTDFGGFSISTGTKKIRWRDSNNSSYDFRQECPLRLMHLRSISIAIHDENTNQHSLVGY